MVSKKAAVRTEDEATDISDTEDTEATVDDETASEEGASGATREKSGAAAIREDLRHSVCPVDDLKNAGIADADIKRLKEGGLHTVQSIIMQTRRTLSNVKGLSDAKVEKIVAAAHTVLKLDSIDKAFITGYDALLKRQNIRRITTGCSEFDVLLGGGIESMSITEVFGEFRTGKTQLAHTLAVTAQLPLSKHGGNGKVVYIDTEGTFRPEKIPPIAGRFGLSEQKALENIIVARVYNYEQQMECISALPKLMVEHAFAMIIIDSITALFRVDFTGRGQLADRQQVLGQHLSGLIKLADEFNVAIFITNQVMAQVDGAAMFTADPKKPIGGHILAHASTTRLYLRKGRGETRVAKIYDSPSLAESEATYGISAEGICDAAE